MKYLAVSVLGFVLAGLFPVKVSAGERAKVPEKMNVVVILADDLGWADLGCYGSRYYPTPNLDRLARSGMRFTRAYAAAPVCSPTRASIMTGKHPARLRLTNFLVGKRWPENSPLHPVDWNLGLSQDEITLAQALKAAGYATGIIGKWHLGKIPPTGFGFDHMAEGDFGMGYFNKEGEYLTDRQARAAEKFIEANKDRPFFLYLAFNAVHVPLQAKKGMVGKYEQRNKTQPAPEAFGRDGTTKVRKVQNHPIYAAMMESMDDAVGRVLNKLKDLGLDEHTVILFTSDNGGLCSAEGWPTTNLPLRLGKGWLYEGGVRVPLIVYWPGHTRPGSTCDFPVISTDFYPTLLEITKQKLRPEQHKDGLSLVPLLKEKGNLHRQTLFWHYPHYSNQGGAPAGAIRHGNFKLIEFFENGKVELYDLSSDPGEQVNLAARMPRRVEELRRLLDDWRKEVRAQMPQKKK